VVEKDLDIRITNDLKPHDHVVHAVTRANQILGPIKRIFNYLDCQLVKQLFTSPVRPHLEYGIVVGVHITKRYRDMIKRVQHRAIRLVPGFSELPYEERLKRMKLTTLKQRRQREDMIKVFKYMNKKYNVDDLELLPRYTAVYADKRPHNEVEEKKL